MITILLPLKSFVTHAFYWETPVGNIAQTLSLQRRLDMPWNVSSHFSGRSGMSCGLRRKLECLQHTHTVLQRLFKMTTSDHHSSILFSEPEKTIRDKSTFGGFCLFLWYLKAGFLRDNSSNQTTREKIESLISCHCVLGIDL